MLQLYLVKRGGVEDKSQGSKVSNKFRVNPKLEEKYKLRVNKELRRRNKQGSWEIEPVGQLKEALEMRLINKVIL